jgi:hypothetical protein
MLLPGSSLPMDRRSWRALNDLIDGKENGDGCESYLELFYYLSADHHFLSHQIRPTPTTGALLK